MSTDTDFDFRQYLSVLTRWWWILVLVPIVLGSLAFLYSRAQTPLYRATEDILVQQARSGLLGPVIPGANQSLAREYSELAKTNRLLNQTQEELGLLSVPKATAAGRGSILRITAEHPDPVTARDIASKLSELLIRDIQTSKILEIAQLEGLAASHGITVDREVLQAQMSTLDSLRVIESAEIPLSPFSPRVVVNTIMGIVVGMVLAVLTIFAVEIFSRKIRSIEQVDQLFKIQGGDSRILGTIFRWNSKEVDEGLVTINDPDCVYSEMFRQLRSGIHFARTANGNAAQVFLITSATPSEGKSTVTANLAVTIAHAGGSVIVVDGDLRVPTLRSLFDLHSPSHDNGHATGLGELLMEMDVSLSDSLIDVGVPGLRLLLGGSVTGNPADILSSPGANAVFEKIRQHCDLVLIDSPPVLAAADAMILARYADGVIVTIDMADSRMDVLQEAYRQVCMSDTPILGLVLNKLIARGASYSDYYRRYDYYAKRSQADGHSSDLNFSSSSEQSDDADGSLGDASDITGNG